jgi:hypothetical protein
MRGFGVGLTSKHILSGQLTLLVLPKLILR